MGEMGAMVHSLVNSGNATAGSSTHLLGLTLQLFNSIALGVVLMIGTFFSTRNLGMRLPALELDDESEPANANGEKVAPKIPGKKKEKEPLGSQSIVGTSNLLFITVGLTGIMLLLNDNLVRAFGLVAAITLIRFRVRLSQKDLNSSYLFALIAGAACGLGEIQIAWSLTIVYLGLLGVLVVIDKMDSWMKGKSDNQNVRLIRVQAKATPAGLMVSQNEGAVSTQVNQ